MTLKELKEKFISTMGAVQQTKELFDSAIAGDVDRETLANDIFFYVEALSAIHEKLEEV